MPLHGDNRDRPTYRGHQRLSDGTSLLVDCSHEVLGDDCIQKTVPISVSGAPAFLEPRLLHQFDHPRIPPVREAQFDPEYDHHITFVMPKYAGGSVARRLIDGYRFSVHRAVHLTRQALGALEYAHTDRGYVHRDIKPGNLLLNGDDTECYLADWELAGKLEQDGTAGAIIATHHYMAPECASTGRHRVESDVYAMGMCLFELLNGRIRWEVVDPQTIEERVRAGRRSLPDQMFSPSAFAVHVPDQLRTIVRKAIRTDPDERFSSAREFLRELNQVDYVDWQPTESSGLDGRWVGTWPPNVRQDGRTTLEVTSRILTGGPDRGKRRLVAQRQLAGSSSLRRFGVEDATVDAEDATAVRQFFSEAVARLSHR